MNSISNNVPRTMRIPLQINPGVSGKIQTELRKLTQIIQHRPSLEKENKMSFWSTLEADVNKGLEVAGLIVGTFIPSESVVLVDIAEVVENIESIFAKPVSQVTASTTSAAVQAATTMSVIKQAAALKSKVSS